MGIRFRLGPLSLGTRSIGLRAGPFSANTAFRGKGPRLSSSSSGTRAGPTKTQLRESAIIDYRWCIEQQPARFVGVFDSKVDNHISRSESGAAAGAVVRFWIRQDGDTKATLAWIAADAGGIRREIQRQLRAQAKAVKRQAKLERDKEKELEKNQARQAESLDRLERKDRKELKKARGKQATRAVKLKRKVQKAATDPVRAAILPESGSVAGAWHPDPFRRFAWRWWNGDSWTETVSSNGQLYVDPLATSDEQAYKV